MRARNLLAVFAMAIGAAAAVPVVSEAQVALGGFLGREFDTEEDWMLFGAEARIGIANFPLALNPRLSHQPFDGGSVTQIDLNAVHDLRLASPGTFLPYLGFGAAFTKVDFDEDDSGSETETGLNLIAGTRIVFNRGSAVEGNVQTQYTATEDFANRYLLTFGILVHLGRR